MEPPNIDPPVDAGLPNRPPGLAALLSLAAVLPNTEPEVPVEPNRPVLPEEDAGAVLEPNRGAESFMWQPLENEKDQVSSMSTFKIKIRLQMITPIKGNNSNNKKQWVFFSKEYLEI